MRESRILTDRQTERNYGIDLFRIVSMLMVVTLHILGHGADIWSQEYGTTSYAALWLFEAISLCAVNCYALISGYVGIKSKFKVSNLLYLWVQVTVYTITITLVFKIVHPESVSKLDVIKAFFPVFTEQYWYFTSYFILFLFIPLLNNAVEHISKIKMGVLLLALVIAVSGVAPLFNTMFGGDVFIINGGYSAWWLMILYLIGAFLSKHQIIHNVKKRFLLLAFLLSAILTWLSKVLLPIVENQLFGEVRYSDVLVNYTSITVLFSSVSLLLLFERLSVGLNLKRIIAFLSPLCFGVYLIHENPLIRKYCISGRFVFLNTNNVLIMALCIIGCAISILALCSLLDLFRFWLFRLIRLKPALLKVELRVRNNKNSLVK